MGRLGCALATVLLVTGISGCGDEAEGEPPKPTRSTPASTTTSSPSSTAAPSATPTSAQSSHTPAPELPDAAKGDTAKAAAHFVKYYIELMNYSAATGNTKAIRAASKNCKGCRNYIKLYEKTYRNGGYFENPGWVPKNVVAEKERGHVAVLFDVDAPKSRYKLKGKDKVKVGKSGHYKLRVWVEPHASSWQVTLFAEQADPS